MAPIGTLAVLTILHIMESRSESITRNHLAIAAIIGFLIYLFIFGLIYVASQISTGVGEILRMIAYEDQFDTARARDGALNLISFSSFLYPILFLAYVLVHRFMRYD